MGTRADFYVGRGKDAEWIGSIAFDGYPDGIDEPILFAIDERWYRQAVETFLKERNDSTFPTDGWPWPWKNSKTTDYAYAFDNGKVWASRFGSKWFNPLDEESSDEEYELGKMAEFPDMSNKMNVALPGTKQSGLMVISVRNR